METIKKAPGGGIGVLHAPSHPTHIYIGRLEGWGLVVGLGGF